MPRISGMKPTPPGAPVPAPLPDRPGCGRRTKPPSRSRSAAGHGPATRRSIDPAEVARRRSLVSTCPCASTIARLRRKGRPTSAWPSSGPNSSDRRRQTCVAQQLRQRGQRDRGRSRSVRVAWSSSTRASSSPRARSRFDILPVLEPAEPCHHATVTQRPASAPSHGTGAAGCQPGSGSSVAWQAASRRHGSGSAAQGCSTTIGSGRGASPQPRGGRRA